MRCRRATFLRVPRGLTIPSCPFLAAIVFIQRNFGRQKGSSLLSLVLYPWAEISPVFRFSSSLFVSLIPWPSMTIRITFQNIYSPIRPIESNGGIHFIMAAVILCPQAGTSYSIFPWSRASFSLTACGRYIVAETTKKITACFWGVHLLSDEPVNPRSTRHPHG